MRRRVASGCKAAACKAAACKAAAVPSHLAPTPLPRRPAVPEYVLDGRRTTTLEALYAEVGRVLLGDDDWGADLGALDRNVPDLGAIGEVLRGGHGPVPTRFRLVWTHAAAARAALGYPETVRQLTARLRDCPPNVLIKTAWALRAALRGEGPTAYDRLVALIRERPNVTLVLRDEGGA